MIRHRIFLGALSAPIAKIPDQRYQKGLYRTGRRAAFAAANKHWDRPASNMGQHSRQVLGPGKGDTAMDMENACRALLAIYLRERAKHSGEAFKKTA